MHSVCHTLYTQMEAVWINRGDYFLSGASDSARRSNHRRRTVVTMSKQVI